jgi:hypothetical protein
MADAVFYIQEGKVKVFVVSDQGKEAVVALHGNGDFFGEGCLIWSAASLGDCLGDDGLCHHADRQGSHGEHAP